MARISDLLKAGKTISYEFFPPQDEADAELLFKTISELQPLQPAFVSVTYRGGRSSRERTTNVVRKLRSETPLTPMPHLICVSHSKPELIEILRDFDAARIENVLALGGDPPTDPADVGEFKYALDLVRLARKHSNFCVGVATHTVGHPRSRDLKSDRLYQAEKLREADFGITQFFFKSGDYLKLIDDLDKLGVRKPILPGIMPILSLKGVARMAELSGYPIPPDVLAKVEAAGEDDREVRKVGVELATQLCAELLDAGAPGLHFITLNRSRASREIHQALNLAHLAPSRAE